MWNWNMVVSLLCLIIYASDAAKTLNQGSQSHRECPNFDFYYYVMKNDLYQRRRKKRGISGETTSMDVCSSLGRKAK